MIQANELRIGNYVNQGLEGICSISGYQIHQLSIKENRGNVSEYYNNYEPIPLTEEWLLNLGFTKVTENFFSIKTKKRFSNLEINLKSKRVIIFGLGSCKDILFTKHVHQLQNLYFALTGEELILKQ